MDSLSNCNATVQPSSGPLSLEYPSEPVYMEDSSSTEGDDWEEDGGDHKEHLTVTVFLHLAEVFETYW